MINRVLALSLISLAVLGASRASASTMTFLQSEMNSPIFGSARADDFPAFEAQIEKAFGLDHQRRGMTISVARPRSANNGICLPLGKIISTGKHPVLPPDDCVSVKIRLQGKESAVTAFALTRELERLFAILRSTKLLGLSTEYEVIYASIEPSKLGDHPVDFFFCVPLKTIVVRISPLADLTEAKEEVDQLLTTLESFNLQAQVQP